MRIQTLAISAALATLATAAPALAIVNPLVAQIVPLGGSSVRGNATFFQLGPNIEVGLNLNGNVLLIHKTSSVTSPAVGCAEIKG